MPVYTQSLATGSGQLLFRTAPAVVTLFTYKIQTPGPLTTYGEGVYGQHAFHVGRVGLGYDNGLGFPTTVTWGTYVEWKHFTLQPPAAGIATSELLWWDLQPGVSLYLACLT